MTRPVPTLLLLMVLALLSAPLATPVAAEPPVAEKADEAPPEPPSPTPETASARGIAWLAAHQNENGSWGKVHTVAVTGIGCLAFLATQDEPFSEANEGGKPLIRGLTYLLDAQKEGVFPKEGHTWIHGQGYATLALAEAYGRSLLATSKPDLDVERLRGAVAGAVKCIAAHQSVSGGWWYDQTSPHNHEGSTTVCAVQALVAARNFAIAIDETVLEKGFEYLKKCQNPDGGFDYKMGPGTNSMKEGTAGDVATLALMKRFDYTVMVNGVDFLQRIGAGAITKERFPYYGHFYGCMGLRLYGEEMGELAAKQADVWIAAAHKDLLAWVREDGSWPLKGWMSGGGAAGDDPYATAFAVLVMSVPKGRLSVLNRKPPEIPTSE